MKTKTIRVDKEVKQIIDQRRQALRDNGNPKATRNDALKSLLWGSWPTESIPPVVGTDQGTGQH